ncbi:MAG: PQQ-dependent sugar dehydrogenase [Planctomycetota bacterium]
MPCLAAVLVLGCGGGGSGGASGGDGNGNGPSEGLPVQVDAIAPGFAITLMAAGLDSPAKLAQAPDGRLFVNELPGRIRVIAQDGTLDPAPFATLDVATGGERGLLGLAFSPSFASDHFVYVVACRANPARTQLVRLTDVAGVGSDETVILDDLPQGEIHNGGDLLFLADGTLLVSVGETGDQDRAQADGDLAGRVLRYAQDGSVPGDNPYPGSPEYCRGLRNTYDLALQPVTGGVFGLDNGPTHDDEMNYIKPGKNYEWPELPPSWPQADVGVHLHVWHDVITPTAMAIHDGTAFGADYANNVFLCSYNLAQVRRLPMSGAQFTDIDAEETFVQFATLDSSNKPLCILAAQDGSLWIGTFNAIWKVTRQS